MARDTHRAGSASDIEQLAGAVKSQLACEHIAQLRGVGRSPPRVEPRGAAELGWVALHLGSFAPVASSGSAAKRAVMPMSGHRLWCVSARRSRKCEHHVVIGGSFD